MADKTVLIEEIRGCEGNCLTINDTRIAGPKPWGGGYVIRNWKANADDIMSALQIDAVKVVRCKDCKHCKKHPTSDKVKLCTNEQQWVTECYPLVHDDDFCSYGERREGE